MDYYFQIPVFVYEDIGDDGNLVRRSDLDNEYYILQDAADNWNSYMDASYLSENVEGLSENNLLEARMLYYNHKLYIRVGTENPLSTLAIQTLAESISGQCSDGWGEGYEQFERYFKGYTLFVKTWEYKDDKVVTYDPDFPKGVGE